MTKETQTWYERKQRENAEGNRTLAIETLERDMERAALRFEVRRQQINEAFDRWSA